MTDEELIARLNNLFWMLKEDGHHTKANTARFAAARLDAQAAEIERLRGDLTKAVEAFGCWNRMMNNPAYDMGEMVSEFDAIARTTLAELTGAQKDGN